MEDSNTLDTLLERAGKYYPIHSGGLATHVPMVLTALKALGAPKSKLVKTFNQSIDNLEKIDNLDNVTAIDVMESELGNSKSYLRYLKYFQSQLENCSLQEVLNKALPKLLPGIAASAFHGLIRLAFAIEANCKSEIAVALAYWSAEFQSFGLGEETTDESLEDILIRLSPLGENFDFSPGIIVDRMSEIGGLLRSRNEIVQPKIIDLETLRAFVLKIFYLQNDFTLLHTVTGCHALSVILPYIESEELALKELWKAILVGYLSTGLKFENVEIEAGSCDCDFSPIIAKALNADDAHIIKLIYSSYREYQKTYNPLYFFIAKRVFL
ncbi:questin oxidase family protein [Pseudoalteromonas sp. OOF1S-7]|uniref:questin oxidase family protein n=1 Tax=Pseudoalteromonas sp. OOF1S-7 TaxID=2917757 RepID=UPI001EF5C51F|nr:questin oxidase family protein [Pseudoalteromonas sp. OOF1S-7]MCG7537557.1 questin oxidase family protein [Pseudoalteromonas sp. OOF1S-7]